MPEIKFKPVSYYIVVEPDWDPVAARWRAWTPRTLKAASAERAYFSRNGDGPSKIIVRVDTTYTVVEDGTADD